MPKNNKTNKNRKRTNGAPVGPGNPGQPASVGIRSVAKMTLGRTMPFGFPTKLLTKLRYADTFALTSAVGSTAKQFFRMNSTFDPDITSVGHQPLYRDTFAAIYDQYAVVSSVATIKLVNPVSSSWITGLVCEDDSTSSSSISTLMEQPSGRHILLPPVSGSISSGTMVYTFDAQTTLGIDPYTSQTYKTAIGSNPTEESNLVVWGADATGATSSILGVVEIVYTVLWTELTTPTGS